MVRSLLGNWLFGKSMKINTLNYIDSLRWIAITLVLIVHAWLLFQASGTSISEYTRILMGFWQFWVILFFLVSAYTLFRSLDIRKEHNIKYFFIRRFFRIAPLYYSIILILYFTTSGVFDPWSQNISWITIWNVLLHIFFLNGFFSDTYDSIVWVEWTIFVEVWFYILLPLIYFYRKHIHIISIALLMIMIATFVAIKLFSIAWPSYVVIYKSPLIQFFPFLVWCYMYIYEDHLWINTFFQKYKYTILVSLLALVMILAKWSVPFLNIIMTLAFSCFFLVIKNTPIVLFNNRYLQFIGKISFSLYLIHFIVLTLVINNWSEMFFHSYSVVFILCIVYWFVFLLSTLSYFLIEVNGIKLWQRIISSWFIK